MGKRSKHKNEICYFCGAPASSTEHVPPKQMFRAFDCDRITVPSCEAHNSNKGGDDQSIVSAFLLSLVEGVRVSAWSLEPDVEKALNVHTSAFQYVKNSTFAAPLITDAPKPMPNLGYSKSDLKQWIRQVTAAILFSATQTFDPSIEWANATIWSPNWLSSPTPTPITTAQYLEQFEFSDISIKPIFENREWAQGWSARPRPYPKDIFRFYLNLERHIFFKHVFYNRYTWYICFDCTESTKAKLIQRAKF